MKHEQYFNFKTQHLNVDRVCTFNSQNIEQDENEVVGFYPTVQTFVVSKIYFKSKLMLLFSKDTKDIYNCTNYLQLK